MKTRFQYFLLLFMLANHWLAAQPCSQSQVSLISFIDNGSSFDYEIELCIGGGILGSQPGAGGPTSTFAIGIFNGGNAITVSNFTTTLISDTTGVTAQAQLVGGFFGSDETIGYIVSSPTPYTCISSTAQCGTPHADCSTINFTTNAIFQSLQVFGIEGSGNPVAGCTGDPALMIDFSFLPVELIRFEGRQSATQVELHWQTATERNNDYFLLERAFEQGQFQTLDRIKGNGDSNATIAYDYQDFPQRSGTYYYRLKQVDFDGTTSYSEIISVEFSGQQQGRFFYPNPSTDKIQLSLDLDLTKQINIYNTAGTLVLQQSYEQLESNSLSLIGLKEGLYWIEVVLDNGEIIVDRLLKL